MQTHNFENLEMWKRGCRLAVDVCVASSKSREFDLKDQITRSAISIPSNIAEGAERSSDADFSRFLSYSKGSCGELRTQLYIAAKLHAVESIKAKSLIAESKEISAMLEGLRKSISQPQKITCKSND